MDEGLGLSGRNKPTAEIIEHWYALIPELHFSTRDFYAHIEEAISAQKVPALVVSRIDLSEGGLLADKREYLRMKRERLIFDVCGAPVGIHYFFSYRFYVEIAPVMPWQIAVLLFVIWMLLVVSVKFLGIIAGPILLLILGAAAIYTMRNAIGLGLRDLDTSLLKSPVLGPIYERYFRKDSWYREDVRIAYCSIVSAIVKSEVSRFTAEKGVKLVREFCRSPHLADLYRAKDTTVSDLRAEAGR